RAGRRSAARAADVRRRRRVPAPEAQGQPAARRHRLDGVREQVRQNLLDLTRVDLRDDGLVRRLDGDRHPALAGETGEQLDGPVGERAEVAGPEAGPAATREVEQLADDGGDACRLLDDDAGAVLYAVTVDHALH